MRLGTIAVAVIFACAASAFAADVTASLDVRWSGTPPDASQKLALIPVDIASGDGFSRAEAIHKWTIDAQPAPHWSSLPSGTYRIVLHGKSTPIELGEVVLAPGEPASVTLKLPGSGQPQSSRALLSLTLSEHAKDTVVSLWAEGERIVLQPKSIRTHGDGVLLEIPDGCFAGALAVVETPATVGSVRLDDCARPLRVATWPKATVVAHLSAPPGVTIPSWGVAHFGKCGRELPFERKADGARIPVAQGCGDPSLRIRGFAPVVVSMPVANAGATRDIGTIALRPGATALVQVRPAARAEPLAGVRISAVRANDVTSMQRGFDIDPHAIATGVSDASGWVRLEGLPEEPVVFVLQTAERRIPQVSDVYTFRAGDEAIVDDLFLAPGTSLFVSVNIRKDLEKSLEIRSVDLLASGANPWPARVPIHADKTDGGYIVRDVPAGLWRVTAVCRVNKGFSVRAATKEVEIVSGADANVSLEIMNPVFSGRVTRGDAPVTGMINLISPNFRENRSTAVATLASDGTFQVLLEPGDYRATVHGPNLGVTLGHLVSFGDPDDEVLIELPSRRISGRVVDASGSPVGNIGLRATETLSKQPGSAGARAADDGRFVIEGVASGTWQVAVAGETGISESVSVAIDDADVDGVMLTFEPTRAVKVRVVDVTGAPMPGAFVHVEFPTADPARTEPILQMTRANGEASFRVTRRQQAAPVTLVLFTADSRLSCALGRLDADQSMTVPSLAGEVQLVGAVREQAGVRGWLVSSTDCAVPFLGTKVDRNGNGEVVLTFPRLAAGQWSYVETHNASEQRAVLTGAAGQFAALARFEVTAGRTTAVKVR